MATQNGKITQIIGPVIDVEFPGRSRAAADL
jgi:F0F1-type ATP synthase beta subunit